MEAQGEPIMPAHPFDAGKTARIGQRGRKIDTVDHAAVAPETKLRQLGVQRRPRERIAIGGRGAFDIEGTTVLKHGKIDLGALGNRESLGATFGKGLCCR